MGLHVDKLDADRQGEWLEQRGWVSTQRNNGMTVWRHPETSVTYNFPVALRMAKQDCKLPADFELAPKIAPTPRSFR